MRIKMLKIMQMIKAKNEENAELEKRLIEVEDAIDQIQKREKNDIDVMIREALSTEKRSQRNECKKECERRG